MGGLWNRLPTIFWVFLIGACALVALPLTTGYYSKHAILDAAHQAGGAAIWLWAAGILGAFLTAVYSFRLVFIAFFGELKTPVKEKVGFSMIFPLVILAGLSLFGALLRPPLQSVFPEVIPTSEAPGGIIGMAENIVTFFGVIVAYLLFYRKTATERWQLPKLLSPVQQFWFSGWGLDWLYDRLFVTPYKSLAALNKNDIVDSFYKGIMLLNREGYHLLSLTQNGQLRRYILVMGFGAVVLIGMGVFS
jgi:NADH-quinone oxidoreductase subunit L